MGAKGYSVLGVFGRDGGCGVRDGARQAGRLPYNVKGGAKQSSALARQLRANNAS
jgi:hypothetical protein